MKEAGISPTQLFFPSVYWENKWKSVLSKTSFTEAFQNQFAPKPSVSPCHDISPLVLILNVHRCSICNEISLTCLLGTSWNRNKKDTDTCFSLFVATFKQKCCNTAGALAGSSCKGGPRVLACLCPPPAGKIIPDKQQQGNVQQISLTDEPWTLVSINAC